MRKYNCYHYMLIGIIQIPVLGLLIYDIINYPDNFLGYFLAQLILSIIVGIPLIKMLYIFIGAILMYIRHFRRRI